MTLNTDSPVTDTTCWADGYGRWFIRLDLDPDLVGTHLDQSWDTLRQHALDDLVDELAWREQTTAESHEQARERMERVLSPVAIIAHLHDATGNRRAVVFGEPELAGSGG